MSDGAIPVKYVLYSHFGYREGDDLAMYKAGISPEGLESLQYLFAHLRGLKELLNAPGHEGILVLFYAPGYERFLEGLAHKEEDESLLANKRTDNDADFDERVKLQFAKDVSECVRQKLVETGLTDRVRFLTSFDLRVILGRVNAIFAGQFRRFFIGPAKGIRYDAPKVVEAILRLRVLGNGVPVLRVDHDVIFCGTNQTTEDLGLFKAVACAIRAYRLRLDDSTVSTFLFSASYNSRALLYETEKMDRFEAWSRAFATRVYPALVADPHSIKSICGISDKKERDAQWNEYVKTHLDDELARRFYGLKDDRAVLEVNGIDGLTSIGAHLDDVTVTKARPAVSNLPVYIFQNYLPTLLWGTIMDAWITYDPILKCRVAKLQDDGRVRWRNARERQQEAPLASAMLEVLREGSFDPDSEERLREQLTLSAVARIEHVRQLWAGLTRDKKSTFARYWAQGNVKEQFGEACFEGARDILWQGIAPGRPLDQPVREIGQSSAPMALKVRDLVADAVGYVHWTLEWPRFVQIVRSIRQGTFIGDLSWPLM